MAEQTLPAQVSCASRFGKCQEVLSSRDCRRHLRFNFPPRKTVRTERGTVHPLGFDFFPQKTNAEGPSI